MRKILSLLLIFVLISSLFCGCKSDLPPEQAFAQIEVNDTENLLNRDLIKALDKTEFQKPKNIIFMIGDGMGQNIITATEATYTDKLFEGKLAINYLPIKGWSRTRSADNPITDSAAGGTALSTGYRTANGVVAMNKDCTENYETVLEFAAKKGKSTGIVVTKSVTDATPAAFSAHAVNRNLQEDIALQQIHALQNGTLDLLFGGGYSFFATDDNLAALDKAKQGGLTFINSFKECENSSLPLLALFETGVIKADDEPSLAAMTHSALKKLSADKNGFFLMVEGSQIDSRAHENNIWGEVVEMREFDNAIAVALNFVRLYPDTLLIITADHETGGLTLPKNISKENLDQCTYKTGEHTNTNVPVFAIGYGAEKLGKEQDNTDIAKFLFNILKD